jgi:oligoribonuclease NrnB/cAMP/cGMP phosphodiesterase (DHH superfamily)
MDTILFHSKCLDGFCAAFIASKRYPEAELIGLDHGDPVPYDTIRGKDVLVLDYSWPTRELNIELSQIAKSFRILDHHKSALERLEGLDFATFDMNRSGAGLAWDYLFGKDSENLSWGERPWFVDFVEDRDLWNWALPNSKAINAYLMSLPMDIESWSCLDKITHEIAAISGIAILRHIDHYVKGAVDQAQFGTWDVVTSPITTRTYSTAIVNALYMNCSEVGNALAQKVDVGLTWFESSDAQIHFSLRSVGDIDVSSIAKLYGGGGHLHASGFRLSTFEGRRLIDSILGRSDGRERSSTKIE